MGIRFDGSYGEESRRAYEPNSAESSGKIHSKSSFSNALPQSMRFPILFAVKWIFVVLIELSCLFLVTLAYIVIRSLLIPIPFMLNLIVLFFNNILNFGKETQKSSNSISDPLENTETRQTSNIIIMQHTQKQLSHVGVGGVSGGVLGVGVGDGGGIGDSSLHIDRRLSIVSESDVQIIGNVYPESVEEDQGTPNRSLDTCELDRLWQKLRDETGVGIVWPATCKKIPKDR